MLKLKLRETLESRGIIKPYTWLMKTMGFHSSNASRLLHEDRESLTFKKLFALCRILDCTPNDLFYYARDERQQALEPDHSLNKLNSPDKMTGDQQGPEIYQRSSLSYNFSLPNLHFATYLCN